MNTWIYKMVAMRRRFRIAAEQQPLSDSERVYWDRRLRKWAGTRSYVTGRRPAG